MTLAHIRWLFGAAIAVSIVHYIDNVVRFDRYTVPDPNPAFAWINAPLIALGWFVFTGFGIWGYRQLVDGRTNRAALGFGIYSGSGLVGLGHFVDVPASSMDALQLTFIVLDVVLGVAIFVVAMRLALGARPAGIPPSPTDPEPIASGSQRR